ncbi:MAG: LptA/OstA family protein [Verrucomicrobiae bacterium]|nr:LptA/OstA family protein [Verrucomicrobiae bacterium]
MGKTLRHSNTRLGNAPAAAPTREPIAGRRAGALWDCGTLKSAALLVALLLPGFTHRAAAQPGPTIGTVGEFAATGENYDPPHERQPRWRLSGREAELLEGGRYRLKQVQLEFFRPTGEREALVAAPECIHDAGGGRAHSSGPLKIESGDGRAAIQGEGFVWEQSAATLIISNAVRATLQRALTNPPPPPLIVTARWFSLEITNRRAVFHEQVRGEDAEFEFTCGRATVHSADTNAMFDLLQAEEGLAVLEKSTGRRITAEQALYTRATERAELVGQVTWSQPGQSGRADRLRLDRKDGSIRAHGHVTLRLPPDTFGPGVLFGPASNAAPMELRADSVFSHTNFVIAEGAVTLANGTQQLNCDALTARLDAARQNVESALATGNVRVQHTSGTLRAERAEYSRADAQILFTGNPEWSDARARGRANRLTLHTTTGQLLARETVTVTLPLSGPSGSLIGLLPGAAPTNPEPRRVQVSAQTLATDAQRAVFSGGVRAHQLPLTGSEPRLQCDTLELRFAAGDASSTATDGAKIETLHASGQVVCEQGQPGVTNGPAAHRRLCAQTLIARADPATGAITSLLTEGNVTLEQPGSRATGGRAAFQAGTGLLELTQSPELETAEVRISGARALLWDTTHDRYAMHGPFKVRLRAETARQMLENLQRP